MSLRLQLIETFVHVLQSGYREYLKLTVVWSTPYRCMMLPQTKPEGFLDSRAKTIGDLLSGHQAEIALVACPYPSVTICGSRSTYHGLYVMIMSLGIT